MNIRKAVDYSAMFAALEAVMEADLPQMERYWYIRQAAAQNLSKSGLLQMIEDSEHLESVLDEKVDAWYNEDNDENSERTQYEEDHVYLSQQYLPQPHGRICYEGLGKDHGFISNRQPPAGRRSATQSILRHGASWPSMESPATAMRRGNSPDRIMPTTTSS